MNVVMERLLDEARDSREDTLSTKIKSNDGRRPEEEIHLPLLCNCQKIAADRKENLVYTKQKERHQANKAAIQKVEDGSSDSDALVVFHALSVSPSNT